MNSYLEQHVAIIEEQEKDFRRRLAETESIRLLMQSEMERLPIMRATPNDYVAWLRGYLEAGGTPTHHYDYNMPESFMMATMSFELPAAYGAQSIQVIVPEGLTVRQNGHCTVYNMADFTSCGRWVPMYNDVARLLG